MRNYFAKDRAATADQRDYTHLVGSPFTDLNLVIFILCLAGAIAGIMGIARRKDTRKDIDDKEGEHPAAPITEKEVRDMCHRGSKIGYREAKKSESKEKGELAMQCHEDLGDPSGATLVRAECEMEEYRNKHGKAPSSPEFYQMYSGQKEARNHKKGMNKVSASPHDLPLDSPSPLAKDDVPPSASASPHDLPLDSPSSLGTFDVPLSASASASAIRHNVPPLEKNSASQHDVPLSARASQRDVLAHYHAPSTSPSASANANASDDENFEDAGDSSQEASEEQGTEFVQQVESVQQACTDMGIPDGTSRTSGGGAVPTVNQSHPYRHEAVTGDNIDATNAPPDHILQRHIAVPSGDLLDAILSSAKEVFDVLKTNHNVMSCRGEYVTAMFESKDQLPQAQRLSVIYAELQENVDSAVGEKYIVEKIGLKNNLQERRSRYEETEDTAPKLLTLIEYDGIAASADSKIKEITEKLLQDCIKNPNLPRIQRDFMSTVMCRGAGNLGLVRRYSQQLCEIGCQQAFNVDQGMFMEGFACDVTTYNRREQWVDAGVRLLLSHLNNPSTNSSEHFLLAIVRKGYVNPDGGLYYKRCMMDAIVGEGNWGYAIPNVVDLNASPPTQSQLAAGRKTVETLLCETICTRRILVLADDDRLLYPDSGIEKVLHDHGFHLKQRIFDNMIRHFCHEQGAVVLLYRPLDFYRKNEKTVCLECMSAALLQRALNHLRQSCTPEVEDFPKFECPLQAYFDYELCRKGLHMHFGQSHVLFCDRLTPACVNAIDKSSLPKTTKDQALAKNNRRYSGYRRRRLGPTIHKGKVTKMARNILSFATNGESLIYHFQEVAGFLESSVVGSAAPRWQALYDSFQSSNSPAAKEFADILQRKILNKYGKIPWEEQSRPRKRSRSASTVSKEEEGRSPARSHSASASTEDLPEMGFESDPESGLGREVVL